MNLVLETIQKRRSCRQFESRAIGEEDLVAIVEAGRFAPSGSNVQRTKCLVIQNEAILHALDGLVSDIVANLDPAMHPALSKQIERAKHNPLQVGYQAPVLVVLLNQTSNTNAMADCSCVIENMMLAATSLGIGSCYINQLHRLRDEKQLIDFLMVHGMEAGEFVCSCLALGYPKQEMTPPPRTGNPIVWIR